MHRLLFLSLLAFFSLYADDTVKIYSSFLETKDDIVVANDGITVIYDEYVITAKRALYDKKSGDLELFENIRVNKGDNYKVLGKYAKLNIAKKERLFKPFYMFDKESELWLSSNTAQTLSEDIKISSGTLSGCDPLSPIWTLDFSSTDYNSESKWMNVYNARIYINDIPILYMPYIGYSLDNRRRTGLLMPEMGLSNDEGFFFKQPIYIAEDNWWDLELNPQLRTMRGAGAYGTFRFVDGESSSGEFTTGYFEEQDSYFEERRLQNDSHFGFDLKYDNSDFINHWFDANTKGQSGIYADISHMNDVDYINLKSNNTENQQTASQVFSRVNIFHNSESHFVGAYFKYFQDLTRSNNHNTLQKMPTVQYHNYLSTFFDDHLLYSLDVQANNIQRDRNTNVTQTDINLPLTLRTSMFDEYLNLSYRANLFMQTSLFRGEGEEDELANPIDLRYEDGYFARNSHTLEASTQLARAYKSLSHTIGVSLSYNKSGDDIKSGFYQDYLDANELEKEDFRLYQIQNVEDALRIDFVEYLYDKKGREMLFHRVAQKISFDDTNEELGELENELEAQITSYLSIYNNAFYNYKENKFSKIFNSITLKQGGFNLSASHLYRDTFREPTKNRPKYTNYLTSRLDYLYDNHYSYSAVYNYDLESRELKNISFGFTYKKRCWDFGLRYSQNRRPVLTNIGEANFINDRFVYLSIVLKPLMQSNTGDSTISYRFREN